MRHRHGHGNSRVDDRIRDLPQGRGIRQRARRRDGSCMLFGMRNWFGRGRRNQYGPIWS